MTSISPVLPQEKQRAATRPWLSMRQIERVIVWAGALGVFSAMYIGAFWDASWHTKLGRDTFWTAPHLFIYGGMALQGLAVLLSLLALATTGGAPMQRLRRAPLVSLVLLCSGAAIGIAPLDDLWHRLFGLDVTVFSPPHLALIAAFVCSVYALIALQQKRLWAAAQGGQSNTWRSQALMALLLLDAVAIAEALMFEYGVAARYNPRLLMWADLYLVWGVFAASVAVGLIGQVWRQRGGVALLGIAYTGLIGLLAAIYAWAGWPFPVLGFVLLPALVYEALRGLARSGQNAPGRFFLLALLTGLASTVGELGGVALGVPRLWPPLPAVREILPLVLVLSVVGVYLGHGVGVLINRAAAWTLGQAAEGRRW